VVPLGRCSGVPLTAVVGVVGCSSSLKSRIDSPNNSVSMWRVFALLMVCRGLVGLFPVFVCTRRGGGGGVSSSPCSFRALVAVERWISVPTFGTRRLPVVPVCVGAPFGRGSLLLAGVISPCGWVVDLGSVVRIRAHNSSNSSSRPSAVGLVLRRASSFRSMMSNFLRRAV